MKRFLTTWIVALSVAVGLSQGQSSSKKGSPYEVTPRAGTWMVLAHSYKGRHAKYLSEKLSYELRKKYKLPAWIVNLDKLRGKSTKLEGHWSNLAEPPTKKRLVRQFDEWGILIGGYRSRKDAVTVSKYLRKLGEKAPPKLTDPEGKPAYEYEFEWRHVDSKGNPIPPELSDQEIERKNHQHEEVQSHQECLQDRVRHPQPDSPEIGKERSFGTGSLLESAQWL